MFTGHSEDKVKKVSLTQPQLHRDMEKRCHEMNRRMKQMNIDQEEVNFALGAVDKIRPKSGGGGCPMRTRGREFFRCGRPHILVRKTSDSSNFMMCPHGEEGGREGSIFRDFVRTSFMDDPLSCQNYARFFS